MGTLVQEDLFERNSAYDAIGAAVCARMPRDDRRSRGITLTPQ
jgi:hypothetical protein